MVWFCAKFFLRLNFFLQQLYLIFLRMSSFDTILMVLYFLVPMGTSPKLDILEIQYTLFFTLGKCLANVLAMGGKFPCFLRLFFLHFGSRYLCNKMSDKMSGICKYFCRIIDCEMCDQISNSGSKMFDKLLAETSSLTVYCL
jgi:hypothetical protein